MIQNLLSKISELLQSELAGLITQTAKHILDIPISDKEAELLPLIAIYPGNLEISPKFKQSSSIHPSLQELHQEIILDNSPANCTYQLDKIPVEGFTLCHLMIDGEDNLLEENLDFFIDYQQATITLKTDLSRASKLLIDYSFMSILVIQEFMQEFFIDIWDDSLTNIDKYSSLIMGIILTNNDQLINDYNLNSQLTPYQTHHIFNTHQINQIRVMNGSYSSFSSPFKFQLKFQVIGQLRIRKTVSESGAPI
ncbi:MULTISPECIES: hypothetical protein [Calothrix]|uniref:Uncharacterized protein n=2 Tax=Calothrix TaxID=1186 RepID=A0ABR8AA88_9CYAN|nr:MULTISPECIES: hypothetical protein [Calothrix]MBD2196754.1 hypothetical protein [Calothrix parietina FACHB-288]MBD2225306.1 hypothetical protein [Calothrix anomala FACHB-343]